MNIRRDYLRSILLGLAPLIIGVSDLALWLITGSSLFLYAGLLIIIGGLIFVFFASIELYIYLWGEARKGIPTNRLVKRGLLSGGIIISNFPVAFICIWMGLGLPLWAKTAEIEDITQKTTVFLSSQWHQQDTMVSRIDIVISGHINGSATVYRKYLNPDEEAVGTYNIGPGEVHQEIHGDWYQDKCLIEYDPADVSSGDLRIKYKFN